MLPLGLASGLYQKASFTTKHINLRKFKHSYHIESIIWHSPSRLYFETTSFAFLTTSFKSEIAILLVKQILFPNFLTLFSSKVLQKKRTKLPHRNNFDFCSKSFVPFSSYSIIVNSGDTCSLAMKPACTKIF